MLIVHTLQWATARDARNCVPTQSAASERMQLQNQPIRDEIASVRTLRFVSGRRKLSPLCLQFPVALMIKKDLSTLMFPSTSSD